MEPGSDNDTVQNNNVEPIIVLILNFLFLGLGHIVMGQVNKGVAYIVLNIVFWVLIIILSFFFIGICLIPVQLIWWCMVLIDGFVIAQRLKSGNEVKKGECANSFAKFLVPLFESSHVFVR